MSFGGIAVVWSSVRTQISTEGHQPDRRCLGARFVGQHRESRAWESAMSWEAILCGRVYLVVSAHPTSEELEALARMGNHAGAFRKSSGCVAALILAPPTRGIALSRHSFRRLIANPIGALPAGVLTTFIFVALHFSELIYQPLATFAIRGLAVTAIGNLPDPQQRHRPRIAVHFGIMRDCRHGNLF